jgi:hypothetical protein
MAVVFGLVHCMSRHLDCAVRSAAKPKGSSQSHQRTDAVIGAEEFGAQPAECRRLSEAIFVMLPRQGLVAREVMGDTEHPVRRDAGGHVAQLQGDRRTAFGDQRERFL